MTTGPIYAALQATLQADKIPFEERPEDEYLSFVLPFEDGDWLGIAQALEPEGQAVVYAIWPHVLPQGRLWEGAALAARLNEHRILGACEVNLDSGEFRFRASIDFNGTEPDPVLLRPLVMACAGMSAAYEPAVSSLAAGGSLEDALAALRD